MLQDEAGREGREGVFGLGKFDKVYMGSCLLGLWLWLG